MNKALFPDCLIFLFLVIRFAIPFDMDADQVNPRHKVNYLIQVCTIQYSGSVLVWFYFGLYGLLQGLYQINNIFIFLNLVSYIGKPVHATPVWSRTDMSLVHQIKKYYLNVRICCL